MPVDLVLVNSKIFLRQGLVEAGLAIDGDKIVKIGKETNLPTASKKMNLDRHVVLPGLIDAHVHLRDQCLDYKEDFFTGTSAAANGGVTLVIDMPNNRPVTMSVESLKERMNTSSRRVIVNVAFYSAFPERIDEIECIVKEGAKGFKFFMSEKIGGVDPIDHEAVLEVFRKVAYTHVPVAVHAEDASYMVSSLQKMKREGRNDLDAYLAVHSEEAEITAIKRILKIAEISGARVHICHLTTGRGMEMVYEAKASGMKVSCEVTPHHLLLQSEFLREIGSFALTNPPLRPKSDTEVLWTALISGSIDILASDHAPHALEEKKKPSVWDVSPGFPGLETLLPLMLTKVNDGVLSLSRLVNAAAERPAEIFCIEKRGRIEEGNYADLTVVDVKKEWRIDASKFHSKAKFSPFDGWKVKGKPIKTFVNGRLIMDEGEIVAKPGEGRIIKG
ncbi:MAG: dihydroorotase family protein [Nitrososphaerota archaeon]|nr:dihydroorotase family protein [Candidatus Bathyarchaeota archaeon]MDW8048925.1 dihydroorotase family protein [Nitrososphaerota archaeon]